jgi:hypothetical protein
MDAGGSAALAATAREAGESIQRVLLTAGPRVQHVPRAGGERGINFTVARVLCAGNRSAARPRGDGAEPADGCARAEPAGSSERVDPAAGEPVSDRGDPPAADRGDKPIVDPGTLVAADVGNRDEFFFELAARTYERGAGPTPACGSGSICAAFAAAARLVQSRPAAGEFDPCGDGGAVPWTCRIRLPHGSLWVSHRADGSVIQRGPATIVADVEWPLVGAE